MVEKAKELQYFVNGKWKKSKTNKYMDCYNPSNGEIIAKTPCCIKEEVLSSINAAKKAFPAWADTPISKRVQVLYKMKALWFYMLSMFSEHEKYAKKIKKSEKLYDYDEAVASLFREQDILTGP